MENPDTVLTCVLAGNYLDGLRVYEELQAPTAEDDRWAGLCLHNLGRLFEAKLHFAKAVARGLPQANIELATLYRLTGLGRLAEETLASVFTSDLSKFDRALALRERGAQAVQNGDLAGAVVHLERAWIEGQGTFAEHSLLAPIAQLLGTALSDLGREVEAVQYFEHALRSANPARRAYLNAAYGRSLIYLGRYDQAARALGSSQLTAHHVPLSRPLLIYYQGVLARARGACQHATEHFIQAAELSAVSGEPQIECFARLGLSALATSGGQVLEARRQLARARNLTEDARLSAYVQWREGMLKSATGNPQCLADLQGAVAAFRLLSLRREEMWVWVSLCEVYLESGNADRADNALEHAADLRFCLGEGAPMAVELRYLPTTLTYLSSVPRDHYGRVFWEDFQAVQGGVPTAVEIMSLGTSQLKVGGQAVRLDLARSVELLVYLLDHPGVRLDQIQLDLFPEIEHRTSKSYIHQVRRELEQAVPGLRIPYNRADNTYRAVYPEIDLRWDVADLRRTLNDRHGIHLMEMLSRYGGPFLPKAESRWADMVRNDLQRWIIRVGLETLDDWYRQGEHGKCLDLASRLVEIDPLDEGLNEFLLKATLIVQGPAAARLAYRRVRERYEDEYGEVPPQIGRYRYPGQAPN